MSDADQLDEILADQTPAAPPAKQGDAPSPDELKINPDTGEGTVATSVPADSEPAWADVLAYLGVDADRYEILGGAVEVRSWDAAIGNGKTRRMRYVKARIRERIGDTVDVDVDALTGWIRKVKPARRSLSLDGDRADVLCPADWQIGKAGEALGGTNETVQRVVDSIGAMQDHVRDMRKAGRRAGRLHVAYMGDPTERCDGSYPSQPFRVDTNDREQKRIARWLMHKQIVELAPLYDEVWVSGVASNHGENKGRSGKSFTSEDDSVDLELLEQLDERLAENDDAFGHVRVVIPQDPLVLTWDVVGTSVAHTHGHKATKGGASAAMKLWSWWNGQITGRLPAGDCDVLVAAHYHHPYFRSEQGRTLVGCPTLDGGSRWFTDTRGVWSAPGTLVFQQVRGDRTPRGVEIL